MSKKVKDETEFSVREAATCKSTTGLGFGKPYVSARAFVTQKIFFVRTPGLPEHLLSTVDDTERIAMEQLVTISPVTNKPLLFRKALPPAEIALLPRQAERAFEVYRRTPLHHRQEIVAKALDLLESRQEELAKELTEQIGRPIKFAK